MAQVIVLRPVAALILAAACTGTPALPDPVVGPVVTAPPTAAASAGTPRPVDLTSGDAYEVRAADGRATIRIREQLVNWTAPDDAILTLDGLAGKFALRPDGTFDPASRLTGELSRMQSDDFRRANAARETMNADRFPLVEFRPIRAEGTSPLAATGRVAFQMIGALTVNGVTRELRWETSAEREPGRIAATARTSFAFGDFAMDVPRRGPVLSIVDEIRLSVEIVARSVPLAAACAATPQDVPANYVPGAPVRSRIGSGGYVFQGIVRSTRGCGPLPGAAVEIWLANPAGQYDSEHRATLIAGSDGRYRLDTSVPAAYGGGRAHIHIRVTAPGHRTLVAIFFPESGTRSGDLDLVMEPS
jgi:hypothetical protein